jgi:hypothetical protein
MNHAMSRNHLKLSGNLGGALAMLATVATGSLISTVMLFAAWLWLTPGYESADQYLQIFAIVGLVASLAITLLGEGHGAAGGYGGYAGRRVTGAVSSRYELTGAIVWAVMAAGGLIWRMFCWHPSQQTLNADLFEVVLALAIVAAGAAILSVIFGALHGLVIRLCMMLYRFIIRVCMMLYRFIFDRSRPC